MEDLQSLETAIRNSGHIVCLLGRLAAADCGCLDYRLGDSAYAIETKYGYSPEEIFSATFLNTRTKTFYDFYKSEILGKLGEPDDCMRTLKKMEDDRKLFCIITRSVYSLPVRAGCRNVVELFGSVYQNRCPHCGAEYDVDFIKNAKDIPLCTRCGQPIRPTITLSGEMVRNQLITAVANEIAQADTLLVLGCAMDSMLAQDCVKYFDGNRIILINEEEKYSDHLADMIYHGKPRDILPKVYR